MSSLIFNNQSGSPGAVGSGKSQLYSKTDGKIYQQIESGSEAAVINTATPGVILQVIEGIEESSVTTTTTTWVDTGLEITITPTSPSSKVLLQATWEIKLSSVAGQSYRYTRDGTSLDTPGVAHGVFKGGTGDGYHMPALQHLDSPNTTSAVVYKLQVQGYDSNVSHFNYNSQFRTSMVAMEVAG